MTDKQKETFEDFVKESFRNGLLSVYDKMKKQEKEIADLKDRIQREETARSHYKEQVDKLQKDADKFYALESCGVDNWDGYSESMQLLEDDLK